MQTKIMAHPGFRTITMGIVGAALVVSCFFAAGVPKAHAAQLTETQIQAILNLLLSFNVPQATVTNVSNILHNKK